MNNRQESIKMMGNNKIYNIMKRIALVFLSIVAIVSCKDEVVPTPEPEVIDGNQISLYVHTPKNSPSTYANETATQAENYIDSLYIYLYQNNTLIGEKGFKRPPSTSDVTVVNDSVLLVKYEVDNIEGSTGLSVEVYANRRAPEVIAGEIPLPRTPLSIPPVTPDPSTYFFMSGKANLEVNNEGTGYKGTVRVSRNVAKLRVNVSMNSAVIPTDLEIEYNKIAIKVSKIPENTTAFSSVQTFPTIDYAERTGAALRPFNNDISTFNGGQIDSLYLYENRPTSSGASTATLVTVTIPTKSSSEGNKTATYTYTLFTNASKHEIWRNYIYTLDIKVRGQSLDPLISLDLENWNDINIDGSIPGTYLTNDISEIIFDATGKATINFCTDAQAVYFDFKTFNSNNTGVATLGIGSSFDIDAQGIDNTDLSLSPDNFKDGQILLDKNHCGSFSFQLNLAKFPQFPNINFSGSICIRAGNIIKCFSFPGMLQYDAHFIVGDTILKGEQFVSASTSGGNWIEVSPSRLYTNAAGTSYTGGAAPLYLHLDENLTSNMRSGTITLTNSSGAVKNVNILQLPAIPVGYFGQAVATGDPSIYNRGLFTEQLHEYHTLVQYTNADIGSHPANNFVYNGFAATQQATGGYIDLTNYNTNLLVPFNYQATVYSAINYCAYKNRGPKSAGGVLTTSDIKWYLPSQAQLMGMWISYEAYKTLPTASFYPSSQSQAFWSATRNTGYANEAEYLNFAYGNVGHTKMFLPLDGNKRFWTRCVRNDDLNSLFTSMTTANVPSIYFSAGLPNDSWTYVSKGNAAGDENSAANRTVFRFIRVASQDATANPVEWGDTNPSLCDTYIESGISGWRMPTQRELQAIWILQSDIKSRHLTFYLLGDDYYWSATSASQAPDNIWVVYGSMTLPGSGSGNTPHRNKNELSRVRCVLELSGL